ncbi:MAG: hypothetical protein M3O50_20160 [Myxococcota bacterium]|nr:hypothetical protein [Myxococcota bacterium]
MTRSAVPSRLMCAAFSLCLPTLVMGCPKKQPVVELDAGGAPAPPASVTELAPLVDDAGDDAAEAAADSGRKWTGPGMTSNQLKIQVCCNAMRAQAKQIGPSSPEGFQLNAVAAQCDQMAKQIGPLGTAPEFNQLRQLLKSVKLPSACQL